jgi:hypothetical protein
MPCGRCKGRVVTQPSCRSPVAPLTLCIQFFITRPAPAGIQNVAVMPTDLQHVRWARRTRVWGHPLNWCVGTGLNI